MGIQLVLRRRWVYFLGPVILFYLLLVQLYPAPNWRDKLAAPWLLSHSPFGFSAEPTCPKLHDIPPNPRPLSGRNVRCNSTESLLSEFTVDLCYDETQCSYVDLVIRRTNASACAEMEDKPGQLVDDAGLDTLRREQQGPDAFMVKTDGAERKAVYIPVDYKKGCEYTFAVRPSNGGPLSVQLYWQWDTWAAWNESDPEWPYLHEMPFFQEPLVVDGCAHCPMVVSPDPGEAQSQGGIDVLTAHLPPCTAEDNRGGAFLPVPEDEHGETSYRWVNAACSWRHAGLRYASHETCYARENPLNLLVLGDSHARVAYDGIVHRMQGNQEPMYESEKTGVKSASLPGMETECRWDPLVDQAINYSCDRIENVTHLVISVGQHFAKYNTTEYLDLLNATFAHISTLPQSCDFPPYQKQVFMNTAAKVPRNDTFVKHFKERNTNLRLTTWVTRAMDLAKEHGFDTVDQYKYTEPFVHDTPDLAHFLMTDGLDPILDDLIGVLGFCDVPSPPSTGMDDHDSLPLGSEALDFVNVPIPPNPPTL